MIDEPALSPEVTADDVDPPPGPPTYEAKARRAKPETRLRSASELFALP